MFEIVPKPEPLSRRTRTVRPLSFALKINDPTEGYYLKGKASKALQRWIEVAEGMDDPNPVHIAFYSIDIAKSKTAILSKEKKTWYKVPGGRHSEN